QRSAATSPSRRVSPVVGQNAAVVPLPPEPVDTPGGQSFVVRYYQTGTMDRFPSAASAARYGGALLLPLILIGWILNLVVFRANWTVSVTPWHNLPGPRYRTRVRSKADAAARADLLEAALKSGAWAPGQEALPSGDQR